MRDYKVSIAPKWAFPIALMYCIVAAVYLALAHGTLAIATSDLQARASGHIVIDMLFVLGSGVALGFMLSRMPQAMRERCMAQLLAANTSDLVLLYTPQGRLMYVGPACQTITGYSQEQFTLLANDTLFERGDLPRVRAHFEAAFGGTSANDELRIVRRDGTIAWVHTVWEPVRDETGALTSVQVRLQDINEHKLLQERFEQTEEQLFKNEKLALLGRLVSGVMHELNNPLAAVLGYTQLLLQSNLAPQLRADLSTIEIQARRSSKIATNLLSFARQRGPTRTSTDINNVVERTLELRSYHLQTHNIGVDLRLAADLPLISADPFRLQQVLLNLVINAEHALADTDSSNARWDETRMVIETAREQDSETLGDVITIRVSDSGAGIAAETLKHIFEPFFTTKAEGHGTGLGLAISRDIIGDHGGRMLVESAVGDGTTVTIILPITSTPSTAITCLPHDKPVVPAMARVLVVDDEAAIRDVLTRALSQWGVQAEAASDGAAALAMMEHTEYNLVICDLHMPGMDGRSFYAALNATVPDLSQSLIFITGDSISAEAAAFLGQTGCQHLTKPFDIAVLMRTIAGLLPPMERHAGQSYSFAYQDNRARSSQYTRSA